MTFGATDWFNDQAMGSANPVNTCSGMHTAGALGGMVVQGILGGAALRAGGAALRGSRIAQAANRFCFAEDTPVQTPDGLRDIEDVQVGDTVLSRDPETGELSEHRVLQTFVTPDQPVFEITLSDGDSQTVRATGEHPFFVVERGWVPAHDLAIGDEVVDLGASRLLVVGLLDTGERETVYNFEVEGTHTYLVGETGVLVHNACAAAEALKDWNHFTNGHVMRSINLFFNANGARARQVWAGGEAILTPGVTREMLTLYREVAIADGSAFQLGRAGLIDAVLANGL